MSPIFVLSSYVNENVITNVLIFNIFWFILSYYVCLPISLSFTVFFCTHYLYPLFVPIIFYFIPLLNWLFLFYLLVFRPSFLSFFVLCINQSSIYSYLCIHISSSDFPFLISYFTISYFQFLHYHVSYFDSIFSVSFT